VAEAAGRSGPLAQGAAEVKFAGRPTDRIGRTPQDGVKTARHVSDVPLLGSAIRAFGAQSDMLGRKGAWCKERTLSYVALWLKGVDIVAEDEFDDLLEAQTFIFEHLQENRDQLGVTSVCVCDDHLTYFQIEQSSPI
jgi:hypothetical protein